MSNKEFADITEILILAKELKQINPLAYQKTKDDMETILKFTKYQKERDVKVNERNN